MLSNQITERIDAVETLFVAFEFLFLHASC